MPPEPRTLFDKLWDAHVIRDLGDGWALLHIDRHLLHDLSGPPALADIAARGLTVANPGLAFATPDHAVASAPGRVPTPDADGKCGSRFGEALRQMSQAADIRLFDVGRPGQGIVHVIGPELGIVLPGMTVVCGDSHTCTNGGLGALAFGIGSSESTHVLATQTIREQKPRRMQVSAEGALPPGITAKDLALHILRKLGVAGGVGYAIEFAGSTIRAMSVEGRLTVCNLSVEMGAKMGMIEQTTSAPAAALLNGTFIQAFELDGFHPYGPLHSASVVLPALLAVAEAAPGVTGAQFLHAAIAGFEVGPRVGMALHGAQMLSRGWHSGSVFGTHASAAAAGTLLGLDAAQFEDALGLAGTQSCGLMAAQFEAMCKRMHHGFSARNGLVAAHLAAGGYTGIKRVFEREYGGFLSTFGEGHEPDAGQITDGLGTRWETMRIVIKPYAAMGGLHAPLDLLFEIAAQRPLVPAEIERVEVDLSHAVYHHGWWQIERPLTPIAAQMKVAYALAVAILDGAALVAQFTPERIESDDVWALVPRITAHHDPAIDAGGPTARGTARLRIHFTDGICLAAERRASKAILEPQSTGEVVQKYRSLTQGLIAPDRQARLEEIILSLETQPNLSALLEVLKGAAEPAFT